MYCGRVWHNSRLTHGFYLFKFKNELYTLRLRKPEGEKKMLGMICLKLSSLPHSCWIHQKPNKALEPIMQNVQRVCGPICTLDSRTLLSARLPHSIWDSQQGRFTQFQVEQWKGSQKSIVKKLHQSSYWKQSPFQKFLWAFFSNARHVSVSLKFKY